jgi:hypothetical protein
MRVDTSNASDVDTTNAFDTLAVAERLGRRWACVDQSPVAMRVARKRLGV